MKRRQRKPVLDINGESDSPRRRWLNERHSQNGSPSNPLANLLGQYNSDSEGEDSGKPRSHALNDQVNDFLKEIQSIAPENNKNPNASMSHPGSFWQECYDEQTGYPYYWHTQTNQVTWEMPPELKMLHEKQAQGPAAPPHGSHIPQWSNMTSNKYSQSQSNIPEGMIPKEVVVRNRNRQAGILNKPAKPPAKPANSKSPGFRTDDSFDDEGKIEMITSFGNEESESDESELEEPQRKSCLKKPLAKPAYIKPPAAQDHPKKSQTPPQMLGPSLPPVSYGPPNKEKLSDKLSQNLPKPKSTVSNDSASRNEDDILQRLKNQAKLLRRNCKDDSSKSSAGTNSKSKDLKLSLVPGYEDDSDGEEESPRKQGKPLFPIPESLSASNESNSANDRFARKIEVNSGNIRIYEYRNNESEDKSEENSNAAEDNSSEDKQDESKLEHEAKANKFLESLDTPTKGFQRKRRIAFDVAPTKSKTPDPTTKDEIANSPSTLSTDPSERRGLGFAKENSPEPESTGKSETEGKRNAIAFVKSSKEEETATNASNGSTKTKDITEAEKAEMRGLTEPIMEKLKFLSEGSPAASAVQVMAIQIQTLLCAWESGALQETYLRNWLVGTGCELTRLEQTAAPPGWECQWDRSHKRYYYRNASTGEAQWTYPEADIAGGAEEMELCTTPPPPEHEEVPIIEMSAQAATLSTGPVTTSKDSKESEPSQPPRPPSLQPGEPTQPPPPPPKISSPSPPPPPRIYAEDLKRGKKRKGSPETSSGTTEESAKNEKPRAEPLPPGVDPPELAYTLPASALEAGVLYGAQQTNPIYAATLAGTGIPIISPHHPHTALMQGHQLMHYNSAYHQHLHNQAIVAARLSGQEAAVAQFMVAEYARVYENNQVIAKPPVKVPQHLDTSLGSAINSFYSDIASIEKSADVEKEKVAVAAATAAAVEMRPAAELAAVPSPSPQVPPAEADLAGVELKEKKKKKLKTGIGKKQKEMSSMVAKWQKAQKNYKEGH